MEEPDPENTLTNPNINGGGQRVNANGGAHTDIIEGGHHVRTRVMQQVRMSGQILQ